MEIVIEYQEEGGLYEKYRAYFVDRLTDAYIEVLQPAEIEGFYFVLRPDHDYHARVALAAYTESVRKYNPRLAQDLHDAMELMDEPTQMSPD